MCITSQGEYAEKWKDCFPNSDDKQESISYHSLHISQEGTYAEQCYWPEQYAGLLIFMSFFQRHINLDNTRSLCRELDGHCHFFSDKFKKNALRPYSSVGIGILHKIQVAKFTTPAYVVITACRTGSSKQGLNLFV